MQYDASGVPGHVWPRLIYLMGPSGSGKDSMLEAARVQLMARNVRTARRVITRSAEAVGEDAVGVSLSVFEQMCACGEFALAWRANGLAYGMPAYIEAWLAEGWHVLVNGSRAHLAQARSRYPDLVPVLLTVNQQVLRERLLRRGREDHDAIEQRLARNQRIQPVGQEGVLRVDNSDGLDDAVRRLLGALFAAGVTTLP
ncbi:phosphonate metabolism protein/1,5-bisphosphokinase (PRPP-forming) PhnN [Pseudomonas aegrilactucae]|uniref:Ribose 1,5-bisphosphate phosphokinase PhnN n=1 Tax=Pseudomonas aegrilactucae TaxID=2854028 RepID=A0A9Q2XGI0_9PSED|nr:phosphonate metabolism protein/1,5-bisphosphokinase (PRPP-forming) PhnN [Pseudomonas aegrilactucae]MBV6286493.1 phosphonate metabolism protein/1,5-bisphosphokinase (PRPP-forming) PhnN [Pseudomonas aegrilactucae]